MHMWKTLSKGFCNSRESSGKFDKLPQVKWSDLISTSLGMTWLTVGLLQANIWEPLLAS